MSEFNTSSSDRPDLDWSQLRETILMLNLAVAQIDQSMNEGNSSVTTLSRSFTALATNLGDIKTSIEQLDDADEKELKEKLKLIIQGSATTALDKVQTSIIAFQFYDKLSQRLDHVSDSLSALTKLIADPNSLYSPPKWQDLQQSIRSKYTMEEERRMFDNVIAGMEIQQALEIFRQTEDNEPHEDEDDIELF